MANGKDIFTFIAVVKDVNGNLVPDAEAEWQQDRGIHCQNWRAVKAMLKEKLKLT
ncbi:MAG: Ig-like domain-containing protein [Candidatus Phlomobacter fragariae]